jgi:hypothetical protein
VPDIFHGFTATPAPALTAAVRHHLAAAYRADIARAEMARDALPRHATLRTHGQALRFWRLTDQIEQARADLADLGGE